MYNKNFTYEAMWRWDKEVWKDRYCDIFNLYREIEYLNYDHFRMKGEDSPYRDRTDGVLEVKTMTLRYPDVEAACAQQGLRFKCYSMGGVKWLPVTPIDGSKPMKRVLVVQVSVDYDNRNLVMDVLAKYQKHLDMAKREAFGLVFVLPGKPDKDNLFSSVLMEFGSIFKVDLDEVYLDVSNLYKAGRTIKEIESFTYYKDDGSAAPDPDELVQEIDGIRMLCITDRWQHHVSNLWGTATAVRSVHKIFDLEAHIHSICGKRMAEAMMLEEKYYNAQDPELLRYWESVGLRYESHICGGQRWCSLVPLCAYGQKREKLPTVVIFREVSRNNDYLPLIALSGFWDYVDLAAQGEMNLILFVLETPDDNELLVDILEDAKKLFPMDPTRLYLTGHSHNAVYVMKFLARHPEMVAAVATQGFQHCMNTPEAIGENAITDEEIEALRRYEIPMISICGTAENFFLINEPGSKAYEDSVEGYQRRLYCCRCAPRTKQEIRDALTGPSYPNRKLGVPTDDAEVEIVYGRECYIGRMKNEAGKEILRLVTVDNLPHITTPMTPVLSWTFMRRFAREIETGALVMRY